MHLYGLAVRARKHVDGIREPYLGYYSPTSAALRPSPVNTGYSGFYYTRHRVLAGLSFSVFVRLTPFRRQYWGFVPSFFGFICCIYTTVNTLLTDRFTDY